jgi:hypothetical protein
MTTTRKSIITASAAALFLGFAIAGAAIPATADDAGPLGWTYNIETGTYAVVEQEVNRETSAAVSKNLEYTDEVSRMTFDSSLSGM